MKIVGIFGGSFDPIHKGHLAVARAVVREGLADEVWLMVSPRNPLKLARRMAGETDRLEMARLAVATLPQEERERIKVSDFETHLPMPSYTANTLRALTMANPGIRFKWIVGGDNLANLNKWREPEVIAGEYGLIVYPRRGAAFEEISKIPSGCVILKNAPFISNSSTEIREMMAEGKSVSGLTPPEVEEYIKEHKLYQTQSKEPGV